MSATKLSESPDDHNESYGVDAPFRLGRRQGGRGQAASGRQNRRTARQSARICADIAGEMDTRDEDQETGAPPAGLTLAGRPLVLAGRPVTGRRALTLALFAAALLAAGVLRFGWSALLPAYCYLALVS